MTIANPNVAPPTFPVFRKVVPDEDPHFIRLNRMTCVVGARSRVHLPLESPLVSRAHALITQDNGQVHIRDLASRNHLFVNGSAVREATLHPSDLLQIGPFQFRCFVGFGEPNGPDNTDGENGAAHIEIKGEREPRALEHRSFVIGRREDCDLVLAGQAVSRVHAVIYRREGRHFLRDLNSTNGTFVNGQRIHEVELASGDQVRILRTVLRFEVDGTASDEELGAELVDGIETEELSRDMRDSSSEVSAASSQELSATAGSGSLSAGSVTSRLPSAPKKEQPESPRAVATVDDFGFDLVGDAPEAGAPRADDDHAEASELFEPDPHSRMAGLDQDSEQRPAHPEHQEE